MQQSASFRLTVRQGPRPNQQYDLNREVVVIGRESADFIIADPNISRHHARLIRMPSGYAIEDLDSTNGTTVNHSRIGGRHHLNNGDLIGLGDSIQLVYEVIGGGAYAATVVERGGMPAAPTLRRPPPPAPAPAPQPPPAPAPVYQPAPQPVYQPPVHHHHHPVAAVGPHMRPVRDYMGQAILTLVLYYLGVFFAGLIANIVFLNNARRDQAQGFDTRNVGCLTALLWWHVISLVIGCIVFAIMAALGMVPFLLSAS